MLLFTHSHWSRRSVVCSPFSRCCCSEWKNWQKKIYKSKQRLIFRTPRTYTHSSLMFNTSKYAYLFRINVFHCFLLACLYMLVCVWVSVRALRVCLENTHISNDFMFFPAIVADTATTITINHHNRCIYPGGYIIWGPLEITNANNSQVMSIVW